MTRLGVQSTLFKMDTFGTATSACLREVSIVRRIIEEFKRQGPTPRLRFWEVSVLKELCHDILRFFFWGGGGSLEIVVNWKETFK